MNREERIAKLPVWAQDILNVALKDVEELQAEVDMLRGESPDKATVFVDPYHDRTPIGNYNCSVEFNLEDENVSQKRVRISYNADAYNRGKHLVISADNRVRITPQAANSFTLEVD